MLRSIEDHCSFQYWYYKCWPVLTGAEKSTPSLISTDQKTCFSDEDCLAQATLLQSRT